MRSKWVGWSAVVAIAACDSDPSAPPNPTVPPAPPSPTAPQDATAPKFVAPWRVDSVSVKRGPERPSWALHVELMVTRLRDGSGTELANKLSCLVGANVVADVQNFHVAKGISVGERSAAVTNHRIPGDLIPHRCELIVFVDALDREVGRHCIEPSGDDFKVSHGKCPPLAEAPPPVRATDRQIGTVPWRLDSVKPERWTDRKNFAVRLYLSVTRLREVPAGTELKSKLSCQVGGTPFVEIAGLGLPSGPIQVGESAPTYTDHFIYANVAAPSRCEMLVYAQMPGAHADVIDHEVGRACLVPKRDGFTTTLGGCR